MRFPFGVASAPAIFQHTIDNLLRGIAHTAAYMNDILVTGASESEHQRNLEEVFKRLSDAGARLKKQKCAFMLPEVEYLGHQLSAQGLRPTQAKVWAIVDAPAPLNVTQLRSFLGLINYYSKFLPNLSTQLAPLYDLLQKRVNWSWGATQERAFQEAKELLISPRLLTHYDPSKKLILSCDASPYRVGAVFSHVLENGTEHPVTFASRSFSVAERNYAQLEWEGLAI